MDDEFLQILNSDSQTFSEALVNPPRPGFENIYRRIVTNSNEVIFAETFLYGKYEVHVRKEEFTWDDSERQKQEKKLAYQSADVPTEDEFEAIQTVKLNQVQPPET